MPAKLHPIDGFMRDFGRFFRADRMNIEPSMRSRLWTMLIEAERRGEAKAKAAKLGPVACARCGSSAWEQIVKPLDLPPPLPTSGRARAAEFVASLDAEGD